MIDFYELLGIKRDATEQEIKQAYRKMAKKYHPRIIIITSPHNPTGCKIDGKAVEVIIKENPESLLLLDEAYWGFSEEDS